MPTRRPSPNTQRNTRPFTCPRDAWRQLTAAIDRTFHTCERYWHQGRYYVRHHRTFLALVRDPDNNHIEVRIAAPRGARRRTIQDTFWNDNPNRDAPPPHLHTIRIRDRNDIARAIRAARKARRTWGARNPRRP